MWIAKIYCDSCGKEIVGGERYEIRHKGKETRWVWEKADICDDCMNGRTFPYRKDECEEKHDDR